MKNKNFTDNRIEEMLCNYCSRTPQKAFDFKNEKVKINRNKKVFRYATVCLFIVLILSAGIFSNQIYGIFSQGQNTGTTSEDKKSAVPSGFMVTAFAAEMSDDCDVDNLENKSDKLTDVQAVVECFGKDYSVSKTWETRQFKEDGSMYKKAKVFGDVIYDNDEKTYGDKEDDSDYTGKIYNQDVLQISFMPVYIKIISNNVESIDISSKDGAIAWYQNIKETNDNDLNSSSYLLRHDRSLNNLNAQDLSDRYVCWYPDGTLTDEVLEHTGVDLCNTDFFSLKKDDFTKADSYSNAVLQTSKDFTKYFGDTLTITAHYTDGTTETAEIEITIDYTKQSEDVGYGNYVMCYK